MSPPDIKIQSIEIRGGMTSPRVGQTLAKERRASLEKVNTRIAARLSDLGSAYGTPRQLVNRTPAIRRVNAKRSGVFEPGGQYEITGSGFGKQQGDIFIRFAGATLHFNIDHWSDETLFVGLAQDISGLPDTETVDLVVGVKNSAALRSALFGFRAAREVSNVVPPVSCFSYDKGSVALKIAGQTVWTGMPPDSVYSDGEYLNVKRSSTPSGSNAACFPPGFDRIQWNIPLNPGFEVVDFEWYHDSLDDGDFDGYNLRRAGEYSANWDGDDIRVTYGVQRHRDSAEVLGMIPLPACVSCSSFYKLRLKVEGPRGLPFA